MKVLITRPAHQSSNLRSLLEQHNIQVVNFPTIEIVDCALSEKNLDKIRLINQCRLLVFISANAVDCGIHLINATHIKHPALPPVAAIGRRTEQRLTNYHIKVSACPALPNSASLLETDVVKSLNPPDLVLIFRGVGGKEFLAQELRKRGLSVEYLEVYSRELPQNKGPDLKEQKPDLILISSRANLKNLHTLVGPRCREYLLASTLVLGSPSMLGLHKEMGFKAPPIIATSPLDDDMLEAALIYTKNNS